MNTKLFCVFFFFTNKKHRIYSIIVFVGKTQITLGLGNLCSPKDTLREELSTLCNAFSVVQIQNKQQERKFFIIFKHKEKD